MAFLRRSFLFACLVSAGTFAPAADDEKKAAPPSEADIRKLIADQQAAQKKALEDVDKLATHRLLREVKIESKDGKQKMQTLATDEKGTIFALVAPPRGFNSPDAKAAGEIQVMDADGKALETIAIPFHAHSLNVAPDGSLFVAGDGKVARFGKDRKQIGATVELPHIAELLKGSDALKEKAEKQVKAQKDNFANTVRQFKERLEKLEAKKPEELTKTEAAQLKNLKQNIESFKQTEKHYETITVESVLQGMMGRLRIINGIAASEKDVFIVCGETEGYGFAIWRLDTDLAHPKKIMTGVSGCCGQMDIQCCGGDLLVAENTKHRFAKYDREGKELATGGKRGKETEPGCFGGCCNPMNVKAPAAATS